MKNKFDYYLKVIKPIEKKYMKLCTLYTIFKFEFIRKKKDLYNKILINYYHSLDQNSLKIFKDYFDK